MPDLTGKTEIEAVALLKDFKVTIGEEVEEELSEQYDQGKIIDTDPKKGTTVKEGDVVKLTVSKGKYIVVSDYVGMELEKAQKSLEKLGFKVVVKKEVSTKARGIVIAQSIDKDELVDPTDQERKITLTVSKGGYVVIDDYLGMDVEKAKELLVKLGFEVNIEKAPSEKPQGTVIAQSLSKGHKVEPDNRDRTITLTVSDGISIEVPNVVGMEINAAKAHLDAKGFVVVLNELPTESLTEEEIERIEINKVKKQSLEAFSHVSKKGEMITLYYYSSKPNIPVED